MAQSQEKQKFDRSVTMFFFMMALCALHVGFVSAGWPSHKGRGYGARSWQSSSHGDWSNRSYHYGKGFSSGYSQQNDKGHDSLALHLLEKMCRSDSSRSRKSSRHHRKHSSSSSRSRDRGQSSELKELRAYREHHEALEKARAEKERQEAESRRREQEFAELEARILSAIPRAQSQPPAPTPSGTSVVGKNQAVTALPAKTKKLVEALLEDEISCENMNCWEDVESQVKSLAGSALKHIHQVRLPETTVPKTNAARAAAVIAFLKSQARV